MTEPYPYKPADFGAHGISSTENWWGSGYRHYTAYNKEGGQISWSEVQEATGPRQVVDPHVSSLNSAHTP